MHSTDTGFRRSGLILFIALAFSIQQLIFFLFRHFHAEDAYILYRYVRNFIHGNGLVYNVGENILALTSPLHALLLSALSVITEKPEIVNRVLLWISMIFLSIRGLSFLRGSSDKQRLFSITVIISPYLIFWSLGGLETVLLACVILEFTRMTLLTGKDNRAAVLLYLLAAIAFLIRYDSVVYTFSIILILFLQKKIKLDVAILPGLMLVMAWFIFSMVFYHNFLPTSFYIKTPSFAIGTVINNALYILHFFVLSGIIVIAPRKFSDIRFTPVLAGILAVLAYGLTCATTHMFFSYRMILPYLPATVLFLLAAFNAEIRYIKLKTTIIACVHLFTAWWMLNAGIDPRLPFVEADFSPRHRTVKQYHDFMTILDKGGKETKEHLHTHFADRQAKVVTFAGGYLPYQLPEAHIYEMLISYRNECPAGKYFFQRFAPGSDYIHIIFPLHGSPESTLGHSLTHYEIISAEKTILNDKEETVYVLWNKNPSEIKLPVYVNEPCSSINQKSLIDIR